MFYIFTIFTIFSLFFSLENLNSEAEALTPFKNDNLSIGVEVSARSSFVVSENGKILFEKNADEILPIASITKLLTALVIFDLETPLNKEIKIIREDSKKGGRIYLGPAETLTVEQLLYLAFIPSSNQAVSALVRSTGLDEEEFVAKMNKKAHNLGMLNSNFFDPTGVDPKNVSTSRDLAFLFREAKKNELITKITQLESYSFKTLEGIQHKVDSTDKLLNNSLFGEEGDYKISLAKTGYLDEAGYCFGAIINKNVKNEIGEFKIENAEVLTGTPEILPDSSDKEEEMIVIVLGATNDYNRFADLKALTYWGFKEWMWK